MLAIVYSSGWQGDDVLAAFGAGWVASFPDIDGEKAHLAQHSGTA